MTNHRLERDLLTGKLDVPLTTLSEEAPAPADTGRLIPLGEMTTA
jgi:hypothetical protein